MIGLRAKLAAYFVLLALLPAAAAFWGISSLSAQDQARAADTRLETDLRATLEAYQARLATAESAATSLARRPALDRQLVAHDRRGLAHAIARDADVEVVAPDGMRVGALPPALAVSRRANVRTAAGLAGTVVVSVPVDDRLAEGLRVAAKLVPDDTVAFLRSEEIVAASSPLSGRIAARPGTPSSVELDGVSYRVLVTVTLDDFAGERIAVLSPDSLIAAATGATRTRLLSLLAAMLVVVAAASFIEGRAIIRTLRRLVGAVDAIAAGNLDERVPVRGRDELAQLGRAFNEMANELERRIEELGSERARLVAATARIGDALASTHDPEQLLHVLVETVVEATGATSALLVGTRGDVVRIGEPGPSDEVAEFPLLAGETTFGTLTISAARLEPAQLEAASSLAAQAVVALENARLHAIVARQASIDGLTGLANRRQLEQTLARELSRARRFQAPLSIVLADVDDFKAVNDRHGHAAGDLVLRALASSLLGTVRDIDLAGRWGGEEFLLLLPGTDLAGAVRLAERAREAVESHAVTVPDGAALAVTASFGVAANATAETVAELFEQADQALYRAKAAGKNRVVADGIP